VLYVPGVNVRAIEKARELPCDALILDLEDSVAPARKAEARVRACEAVASGQFPGREAVIRVNPLGSPEAPDDIVAACAAEPDAILVPKITSAADVERAELALVEAFAVRHTALWLMIETPRAALELGAICAAIRARTTRVGVLVMGLNDLSKETRVPLHLGRASMLPWLSNAVLAARAYGFGIVDGVFNSIADGAGFIAECHQGRSLGFDGKTVIHPNQIAPANAIFAPDHDEISEAQSIVAAFSRPENTGAGVIQLDGKMIERLHLAEAERVLAMAQAAGLL
jgi:citrate lyase subunit beta/citryl-CoA lyase